MKYFNIKRYKFSTILKKIYSIFNNTFTYIKHINLKKLYNYLDNIKKNFNFSNLAKKIKFKGNKFLFFHIPIFTIFFGFLYLAIPTFFKYDKSILEDLICVNKKIKCKIIGKINYSFFPSPRIKATNLVINKNKGNLLKADYVTAKLSIKNLLAKEKHKIQFIKINNFESKINLKDIKNYINIFSDKISTLPINLLNGKILLYDNENYITSFSNTDLILKFPKDSIKFKLNGKLLSHDVLIDINKKISDNKPLTDIEIKIKDLIFYSKISFYDSINNIENGKFLIRQSKNKSSGFFNYHDNTISLIKSNISNPFIDGKLIGKISFLPYFDFNLDLNLNSINFTRLYNYFLQMNEIEQKKLFKINNKLNGKLNFSSEKVYSKNNLVKSFESRINLFNGNVKIEQLLINLGKLGAADLLGNIKNEKETTNFKFESNIFVDNKKKFLNKFGIYNNENLASNLFVQGNFDLDNIRISFYEISDEEKMKEEDINFIESEFNDLMLEKGFEYLFNFQKFKVFLKSARDETN